MYLQSQSDYPYDYHYDNDYHHDDNHNHIDTIIVTVRIHNG